MNMPTNFPRALRGGRIFAQAQSPEQMFGELRTAVSGLAAINSIANGRGFDGKILRTRHRSSRPGTITTPRLSTAAFELGTVVGDCALFFV